MNELVGRECRVNFTDDPVHWPFPGFPAWVQVLAVDMPMVKMANRYGDGALWINVARIADIQAVER